MKINSKKIRQELEWAGMTVKDLADKLVMTDRAIEYILEKETTKLKTITKIGKVLAVDPKDLLI